MSRSVKESAFNSTITTPTDREIRIERVFNAPRDRVWRAFTEPEAIAQWWGRGNRLVIERMDEALGEMPRQWARRSVIDGKPDDRDTVERAGHLVANALRSFRRYASSAGIRSS